MHARLRNLVEWLDDRTGLRTACSRFLQEEIPASAGWAQVFGSVALFLCFVQALTGILLACNYAPTPGDAYKSLRFILQEVTAGHMIRGLHHWGSSLMIIVVFMHMAQVFIYGAYKRPREATWMAGGALLLLTLAFGLTGYLLPWDNRAYWGTVVTTRIMASVPLVGSVLSRAAGAADGIGVVTFARFYAMHTIVLPAAMVALIALHVYLVRRHGVTASDVNRSGTQKFYPKQLFRDLVAVSGAFVVLFLTALLLDVPLERLADPTDTSYVPRPEWYFLFLFELLRLFQGPLEYMGTMVLPAIAVITLFSVPFVGSPRVRRVSEKVMAIGFVLLIFGAWAGLTVAAVYTSPANRPLSPAETEETIWAQLSPEEIAGFGYYRSRRCDSCHNLLTGDPKIGPNLAAVNVRHPKEWLIQHFKDPADLQPGTDTNRLSLPQLNALSLFIANLKPDSGIILPEITPQFIEGAQTYVESGCGSCHKVNGLGGSIGPSLNGLPNRRSKAWVQAHFTDPRKFSPGSIMPPYRFMQVQQEAIMLYLFSLPD